MKLIELLKWFDIIGAPLVAIWHIDEEEDPVFEGNLMDTPYWLLDCELDNGGEVSAITTTIGKNKFGYDQAKLNIYVKG